MPRLSMWEVDDALDRRRVLHEGWLVLLSYESSFSDERCPLRPGSRLTEALADPVKLERLRVRLNRACERLDKWSVPRPTFLTAAAQVCNLVGVTVAMCDGKVVFSRGEKPWERTEADQQALMIPTTRMEEFHECHPDNLELQLQLNEAFCVRDLLKRDRSPEPRPANVDDWGMWIRQ